MDILSIAYKYLGYVQYTPKSPPRKGFDPIFEIFSKLFSDRRFFIFCVLRDKPFVVAVVALLLVNVNCNIFLWTLNIYSIRFIKPLAKYKTERNIFNFPFGLCCNVIGR